MYIVIVSTRVSIKFPLIVFCFPFNVRVLVVVVIVVLYYIYSLHAKLEHCMPGWYSIVYMYMYMSTSLVNRSLPLSYPWGSLEIRPSIAVPYTGLQYVC